VKELESQMSESILEGDFLEEVLKLFAIEAADWIRHIKATLPKLESASPPERVRLYETVLRNLTNMKGSAATVGLPCLDDLAFTLIPILQETHGKPVSTATREYAALRKGVAALSSAITVLTMAERKAAVVGEIESMARQQMQAVQSTLEAESVVPTGPVVMQADNLRKVYREGKVEVIAVDSVSLALRAMEMVAVVGPSGSGKTTLLSMMGFLLTPTAGTIRLLDQRVDTKCEAALPRLRREHIGFIFQGFNLLGALTAVDNILIALRLKDITGRAARREAEGLLERVGLGHRKHFLPRDLSGGERQRVAIARALAGSPSLVLADEPTANLDSKSGQGVIELLREVANEGRRAVVLVTHDTRNLKVVDRIVHLEDGRIVE
jgi:putative ABC transport system ATP-binding protein